MLQQYKPVPASNVLATESWGEPFGRNYAESTQTHIRANALHCLFTRNSEEDDVRCIGNGTAFRWGRLERGLDRKPCAARRLAPLDCHTGGPASSQRLHDVSDFFCAGKHAHVSGWNRVICANSLQDVKKGRLTGWQKVEVDADVRDFGLALGRQADHLNFNADGGFRGRDGNRQTPWYEGISTREGWNSGSRVDLQHG